MNQKELQAFLKNSKASKLTYQSLEKGYHPFEAHHVVQDNATMMEAFFPAKFFIHTPHKWNDFNKSNVAFMESMLQIVELFYYVSQELGGKSYRVHNRFVPDQIATFEKVPERLPEAVESTSETGSLQDIENRPTAGYRIRIMSQGISDEADGFDEHEAEDGGGGGGEQGDEDGDGDGDGDSVYKRRKAKKATPNDKKKAQQKKPTYIPKIVHDLISRNQYFSDQNRQKRKIERTIERENKAHDFLYNINLKQYVGLCSIYTGEPISYDEAAGSNIFHPYNPVNPFNVFNLENSMSRARQANADEAFCTEVNYYNITKELDEMTGSTAKYRYPYPHNVWRMNPTYLVPGNTCRVYWPTVSNPVSSRDHQRDAYIQTSAKDSTREAAEKAAFVFDNFVGATNTTEEQAADIDTLKASYTEKMNRIETTYKTKEEKNAKIIEAQVQALDDFAVIFSPDGDGPDAIKAVAKFLNDYLAEHESLCLDAPKITKNCTQFGDDMISMGISLETLWNVNTQHRESLALFFKNLHVYALSPFNPHTGNFGPGMAGKSFGFILVMKWLIPGTYVSTTYSSSKANVVPGHKNRCLLRFFEDVFPAFLGVHGGAGGKGSETANTDMEAINKAWLTSGRLSAHVLDTTYGRANAVSVELSAKVESVINICSNTTAHSVPYAMRSRYHCNSWQVKERLEGGGLLGKANKISNPTLKNSEALFIMRMRRNQALVCIILHLIYVGVLPAVDMTVARIVFTQTMIKAKKAGLSGTEDIRNFERLEMVCRVLVIWDAINILWDSPDSCLKPDNGKVLPHSMIHFLLVARYLRSNVEHAVMTLGLLNNQYEDPIINTILDDLMKTKFKKMDHSKTNALHLNQASPTKKSNKNKVGQNNDKHTNSKQTKAKNNSNNNNNNNNTSEFAPYEPGLEKEDVNYYIAPLNFSAVNKNARIENNADRLKVLAEHQYNHMKNKPLWDDVLQGYHRLFEKSVDDKSSVVGGGVGGGGASDNAFLETAKIPALEFRDGNMYLSKHIVKEHCSNALQRCTEKAINFMHANVAEYVYGSTRENTPFLFETVRVEKDKSWSNKQLHIIDPNFFEQHLVEITERFLAPMADVCKKSRKRRKTQNRVVNGVAQQQQEEEEEKEQVEENEQEVTFSLNNAFSSQARLTIDLDLNEYADALFLMQTYLTEEQIEALPNGDPLLRKAELVERAEQVHKQTLLRYPDELPHFNPIKYFNDQNRAVESNPERFSARAHLKRLKAIKQGIQIEEPSFQEEHPIENEWNIEDEDEYMQPGQQQDDEDDSSSDEGVRRNRFHVPDDEILLDDDGHLCEFGEQQADAHFHDDDDNAIIEETMRTTSVRKTKKDKRTSFLREDDADDDDENHDPEQHNIVVDEEHRNDDVEVEEGKYPEDSENANGMPSSYAETNTSEPTTDSSKAFAALSLSSMD